jgi:hypothetical protein
MYLQTEPTCGIVSLKVDWFHLHFGLWYSHFDPQRFDIASPPRLIQIYEVAQNRRSPDVVTNVKCGHS